MVWAVKGETASEKISVKKKKKKETCLNPAKILTRLRVWKSRADSQVLPNIVSTLIYFQFMRL